MDANPQTNNNKPLYRSRNMLQTKTRERKRNEQNAAPLSPEQCVNTLYKTLLADFSTNKYDTHMCTIASNARNKKFRVTGSMTAQV